MIMAQKVDVKDGAHPAPGQAAAATAVSAKLLLSFRNRRTHEETMERLRIPAAPFRTNKAYKL
jgi:hypothetical protein